MTLPNINRTYSIKNILLDWIRSYQKSFLKFLPPSCRFYPCCSEYAIQCLEKNRTAFALRKIGWRILRCNPWSVGGVDLP